jgi:hypothetical protein
MLIRRRALHDTRGLSGGAHANVRVCAMLLLLPPPPLLLLLLLLLQASPGSGTGTRRVGPYTVQPLAARQLLMSQVCGAASD